MKQAKVIFEVTAGIVPGEPMDQYTRRWVLSREEMQDEHKHVDAQGAAMNYALALENPGALNWVRFEWIWL